MSGTFSAVDAEAWSCAFLSSNLICNVPSSSSMFLAFVSASWLNIPTKPKSLNPNKTITNPIWPHKSKTPKKGNETND